MNHVWSNHLIALYFLCSKCYLTYLWVAWYWIVAWCYHVFYVQHHNLILISPHGMTAHSPCTELVLSSSSVPQVPAAALFYISPPTPNNWCLACQALELTWRGGSHHMLKTEESGPPEVALCYGACPSTQQWSISPCPSWYHSRGHSPRTGCIYAHWKIRGPSKCGLIWCLQLSFA